MEENPYPDLLVGMAIVEKVTLIQVLSRNQTLGIKDYFT